MRTIIMMLAFVLAAAQSFSQDNTGKAKGGAAILKKQVGLYHILQYNKFVAKKRDGAKGKAEAQAMFDKLEKNFQENKYINGVTPVIFWGWLEPKEGRYEFDALIKIADLCKKYDKGFKLIIIPGIRTPKWVYQHAESVKLEDDGRASLAPVPWDPGFKKKWKQFLLAVDKQFSPYDNFVAISLAGANHRWAETDMPRSPEAIKQWGKYGDYKKRTTDFWKEMVKFYAEVFDKQHISMHIRVPFAGMYREVVEIIDTALVHCPDRITLQNCQLTGVDDNFYSQTYAYAYHYRNRCHIGFQALTSGIDDPERSGSMEMLVFNIVRAKAAYLEVFPSDGFDQDYTKKLHVMWTSVKKLGADQFKKQLVRDGKYQPSRKKRKIDYSEVYEKYH